MSHMFSQSLGQHLRMEQRLTPQLIQSMSILQKHIADLETYINESLESNAALEIKDPEPNPDASTEGTQGEHLSDHDGDRFAELAYITRNYGLDDDSRSLSGARRVADSDRDPKMAALANTPGRDENLQEHLHAQWSVLEWDEAVLRAGAAIIDHIDPDGYLRLSLEAVAENMPKPESDEVMKVALSEVQKLEPSGVGACDLQECLLIQLEVLPGDNQIEKVLIEKHLDDIGNNRLPAIAKATGYSIGEINAAIAAMGASLHMHPGSLVGDRSEPPIRPDVIVEYADTGAGLNVRLPQSTVPELCIRDDVMEMAKTKSNGQKTRDFARQQVESAHAIIDAVAFRRGRILEVTGAIVEKQRDFFDMGPSGLKILRMSDLAEELECDPSTISRTVAQKYVQTPRGIFPLRYFFTGGTETESGESVGWDRVKMRVKELVEAEDKKEPLKDDKIAAMLKNEGVAISRRTVAKYRQQLSIPSARQRRQF